MTRLKLAELTAGVGALILGIGLGALFPNWFGSIAGLTTIAGGGMHAFGMWDKHRLESATHAENAPWVTALYWLCWILLAAVLAVSVLQPRRT
jgi:hypothetical protein